MDGRAQLRAPRLAGLAIAVAAACALAHAPRAEATTRVFRATADATVSETSPRANDGASRRLVVSRTRRAYLRFDVQVPAGEEVVEGHLKLRPDVPVSVRRAGNDWRERRITWRTRPRAGRVLSRLTRTGMVTYVVMSDAPQPLRFRSREAYQGPALILTTRPATATTSPGPPTPPTPPVPPGPALDPIGPRVPLGDLPGWTQVFVDDFTRSVPLGSFPEAVSSKWWAYPNDWHDTSGVGTYDPHKTLSVRGGILNSYIHTVNGVPRVSAPVPRLPYTSGGVDSTPSGRLYGRFSVRFRADLLPGYKTAWLLWPDSKQWPRDGEIDFPEGNLEGTIHAFLHHQGGTSGLDSQLFSTASTYLDWHIATIEWVKDRVTFYLDGQKVGESFTRVPNTPMHWVLQTETNLDGRPVPVSSQGNVQIDWVSVWKPAGPS
jgi:hypothetical protein